MIEYQDIENTVREKGNMGGIWENIYYAPKSDFAEFASKPSHLLDRKFSEMNMLSAGQDRLKTGKKLYRAYSTLEKGSLTAERQGEIDGISHKINLKLFTPGLTSEALAMLEIPNQDWIFYVKTGEQMFRVGSEKFSAKLAPEGSVGTGDSTASAKGNELNFSTYDVGYAGEVVDIAAIDAMLDFVDESLTVEYLPVHGSTTAAVNVEPRITFGKPVVNKDTSQAFTNEEIASIIKLQALDIDGNAVGEIPFTAVIALNVITISTIADLVEFITYQLTIDSTKILSADIKGRINGSKSVRFVTESSVSEL